MPLRRHNSYTLHSLEKIKNGQYKCVIDTREFRCFQGGNISISEFWII